jgi:hypothetical protein
VVTVTFLREGEPPVSRTLTVPALSRETVSAASLPELATRSFGIIVGASQPVVAERSMYFGSTPGRPWTGGAGSAGVTAPSTTWYHAEAATGSFFDTFLLLVNPQSGEAHVNVRYLLANGEVVDVPKTVPALGRLTVDVGAESDPRLQATTMSVTVTSDVPIVSERSMYWPTAETTGPWGESHNSFGAPAASSAWAFAEGRSGGPLNFHTYVLLENPGAVPATVTVQFLPETGAPVAKTYTVAATSRLTIDVENDVPDLHDQRFGASIRAADDLPIIVERSMYWDGAGIFWSGGSNALATPMPTPR